MNSASNDSVLSLILQSTLAVEALFFGVLTLVAALLNETFADVKSNERERAALRTEYETNLQSRDLLDARRQRAIEALRGFQATIMRERSRIRLLATVLIAVGLMVLIATFVAVYSFTLLHRRGVGGILQVAFYALMLAPLASTAIMAGIVRRLSQPER